MPEVMAGKRLYRTHVKGLQRLAVRLTTCLLLMAAPLQAAPPADVLVLYANSRLLPANLEVDRGLREVLTASPDKASTLFAEFLDRPAFSGPAFEALFADYLRSKYRSRPPRVVLVAGQPALDFLLRHRAELFAAVPVVHLAIDKAYLQSIATLPPDVVGVPVVYEFLGTIQQALRWHPDARRLVVVTGTSAGDLDWASQLRADLAGAAIVPAVEFLAGLSTAALHQRLAALDHHDVVFTPGYFRDGAGAEFAPRDSVALMAQVSRAPVYGPFSTFIGTGVVGGRMPHYAEMGRQAGNTVNQLLAGATPASLGPPAAMPALLQLDWRQVQKWGIAADAIPADAVIHFRTPTFWEANRQLALVSLVVIVLQTGLITALLVQGRRRRRTAAALAASEARMNLAAGAARLSMWVWDLAPVQAGVAPKPRRDGAVAVTPFDQVLATLHPADREHLVRAVQRALASHAALDLEYRVLQPDGELRWMSARGRADSGSGQRLTGVALDITARKNAELQAEKDRAALTHMTRVSVTAQLSASIAHQLNQPLAAILGNAEVARKLLDRNPVDLAELRAICTDIVTEDNRAAAIIRRLGALYKRGELQLLPLDLNELVLETLDLVRGELTTRHVVVVTDLAPALPRVDGGRVELQQVLLNLILNAVEAMAAVEPAGRLLSIGTAVDADHARLCVSDRGTGIEAQDIPHVFDAFWSTKVGGTGVGLAICQSIIKGHRGSLTAENNPGGGARFCVSWPLRPAGSALGTAA